MVTRNDIILVYFEDEPAFYARIEEMDRDVKPGWFRVRIQVLSFPVQDVTWILRAEYIDGAPFTMGGKAMRLEKLEPLSKLIGPGDGCNEESDGKLGGKPDEGKVVSLFDRRK
jgi:hypothetical protein